jgi:hypothetical protein
MHRVVGLRIDKSGAAVEKRFENHWILVLFGLGVEKLLFLLTPSLVLLILIPFLQCKNDVSAI